MDHDELAQKFNDSYERVMNKSAQQRRFLIAFYVLLIAKPEAAIKFRDTNMGDQVRMLHASVSVLMAFYGTDSQDDYLL